MEKRDTLTIANEIELVIDNQEFDQNEKVERITSLIFEFHHSLPIVVYPEKKSKVSDDPTDEFLCKIPLLLTYSEDEIEEEINDERDISLYDEERKKCMILDFLLHRSFFLGLIQKRDTIQLIEDFIRTRKLLIEKNEENLRIEEQNNLVWDFVNSIEKKRFSQLSDLNFVEIKDPNTIIYFYKTRLDEIFELIENKQKSICFEGVTSTLFVKGKKLLIITINKDLKVISSSFITFNKKEIKRIYKNYYEEPDYDSRDDIESKERTSFERWMKIHKIDPKRYWKDEDRSNRYFDFEDGECFDENYDGRPKRSESYHYINRLNSYKTILKYKILYFDKSIRYEIDDFNKLPFQELLKLYKRFAKKSWNGNTNLEDSLCIISKITTEEGLEYISEPSLLKSNPDYDLNDNETIQFFRLPYEKCIQMKREAENRNMIRYTTMNN
ncbi:MAG: hypothetical protein NTZ69_01295 [Bacteroidia bacterium]|nr:hypothetical protein [Bacteroidia bacterium]